MEWQLKRTKQCQKCPWKVGTDPTAIPNGYSVKRHLDLKSTIADPVSINLGSLSVMACHEEREAHCIGWLHNQLGRGNNIGLRLKAMSCKNIGAYKTIGKQHPDFESTLP